MVAISYMVEDAMPVGVSLIGPIEGEWQDVRDMLPACADHYYRNHAGWERSWPLRFRVFTADGDQLVTEGPVYLDYQLVFRTRRSSSADSDRRSAVCS